MIDAAKLASTNRRLDFFHDKMEQIGLLSTYDSHEKKWVSGALAFYWTLLFMQANSKAVQAQMESRELPLPSQIKGFAFGSLSGKLNDGPYGDWKHYPENSVVQVLLFTELIHASCIWHDVDPRSLHDKISIFEGAFSPECMEAIRRRWKYFVFHERPAALSEFVAPLIQAVALPGSVRFRVLEHISKEEQLGHFAAAGQWDSLGAGFLQASFEHIGMLMGRLRWFQTSLVPYFEGHSDELIGLPPLELDFAHRVILKMKASTYKYWTIKGDAAITDFYNRAAYTAEIFTLNTLAKSPDRHLTTDGGIPNQRSWFKYLLGQKLKTMQIHRFSKLSDGFTAQLKGPGFHQQSTTHDQAAFTKGVFEEFTWTV